MRAVDGARADADALHAAGPHARQHALARASPRRASAAGRRPTPATSRYVFTRRVEALLGPASYRAHGALPLARRRAARWSPAPARTRRACRQPDQRPNLVVLRSSIEGARSYVALVANTGRTAAAARSPRGQLPRPACSARSRVERSRAAQAAARPLRGPRCKAGTSIDGDADPLDAGRRAHEADNRSRVPCAVEPARPPRGQ